MKFSIAKNGALTITLTPEDDDDKHILEMVKLKSVEKITVDSKTTGVTFHLVKTQ